MKRIAFSLALVAILVTGLVAQEASAPEVVKFTVKRPGVGDVATRATNQTIDLQLDMDMGEMGGQQSMVQKMEFADSRTCTVLEAKGDSVTKFKVAYQKMKGTMKMEAAMLPEPMEQDLLEGRNPAGETYVFTVTDGGLTITNEEGEEASGEMREMLSSMEWTDNRLGAWSPSMADLTEKREISVGETITVSREKALSFVPQQNRAQLGDDANVSMELTLKETTMSLGAKVAVFDSKLKITGTPGAEEGMAMELSMEMTGTMTVGVDNMWVYSSKMKRPMKMEGG